MSVLAPTSLEKENLQRFYLSMRSLLHSGLLSVWSVQRSFEELMHGYMGDYAWQPTHVSHDALVAVSENRKRDLQRAHGIIEGKLDRFSRTMQILRGEEAQFDGWFQFYTKHDSSVLLTRAEHNSNKQFKLEELIELPPTPHDMFLTRGFTFSLRKNVEVIWAQKKLQEIAKIGI